jgi:cold-inducible RNA-binding protein
MQQNKLYVGNLSFAATQESVEEIFSPYGELEEVRLIADRDTGRSRGFAFVTFAKQHAAESALELNGKPLDGRNLIVNIAKERTGGRGGSGRGGGRRY